MDSSSPRDLREDGASVLKTVLEAARARDYARAYDLANAALESGMRHPALFDVRATCLARQGRDEEALDDLEAVRTYMPREPMLLLRIGRCLTKLRRAEEALAILDAAVTIRPNLAQAHYERGVVLGMLNRTDGMQRAHERTVELESGHVDALASLALLAARAGDAAKAEDYAARSLAGNPRHAPALAALAVADIVNGNLDAARQKLAAVQDDSEALNDTRIDIALGVAADAFDARDEIVDAFATQVAASERRRARQLRSMERRPIEDVRRRSTYFQEATPWTAPGSTDQSSALRHVFLVGFMRSGTTLLETILAANPRVVASDEREFMAEQARLFLLSDEGLDRLALLDGEELAHWRDAYWRAVRDAGIDVDGKVFVDKQPFNSLRLPLIARLFPDARILFAVRDPRDVVLSCFRHRFELSHLTFEFLRLEDCANFYAAVMELAEAFRKKLPIQLREHRYEDMIDDFDGAVRDVCEFIGVDWSETMREFRAAVGVINPRSQSAAQVRRGLYKGAIGQWRRYRTEMEPVLPILDPWIARFGYQAD